jgi:hypothetical protein
MNEGLSFRTIVTKVTFVMASVVNLMLGFTCLVLGLLVSTFIFAHVLVKSTLKPSLHCLEVLKFCAETGYSGLPNWTIRF